MAANPSFFHDSTIRKVFFPIFENGTERMVEAPFDCIQIGAEQFLMPKSIGGDMEGLWASDDVDEALYQARGDFGFVLPEFIIVGEHEMGDFDGQPETWKGVHAFSML